MTRNMLKKSLEKNILNKINKITPPYGGVIYILNFYFVFIYYPMYSYSYTKYKYPVVNAELPAVRSVVLYVYGKRAGATVPELILDPE